MVGARSGGRPADRELEEQMATMSRRSRIFSFPASVNETSARVVAGGVVMMALSTVALDQPWILWPLTYGFAARVASGPTLSPLGHLATRVITPRLHVEHRIVPGAPKRLAQGIGLAISGSATVVYYGFGRKRAAYGTLSVLIGAAALESLFGICLACKMFPLLVRAGLVEESACEECSDLALRRARDRVQRAGEGRGRQAHADAHAHAASHDQPAEDPASTGQAAARVG